MLLSLIQYNKKFYQKKDPITLTILCFLGGEISRCRKAQGTLFQPSFGARKSPSHDASQTLLLMKFSLHLPWLYTWIHWSLAAGALPYSSLRRAEPCTSDFHILADLLFRETCSSEPESIITSKSSFILALRGFTFLWLFLRAHPRCCKNTLAVHKA